MATDPTQTVAEPKTFGLVPSGITKTVANEVSRSITAAFKEQGKNVHVKALRFLPSSRTKAGNGFQLVANTIVETDPGSGAFRSRAVDSVVTVDRKDRRLVLRDVRVPVLER